VTRDDGTVALEGKALCYTMPLLPRQQRTDSADGSQSR